MPTNTEYVTIAVSIAYIIMMNTAGAKYAIKAVCTFIIPIIYASIAIQNVIMLGIAITADAQRAV